MPAQNKKSSSYAKCRTANSLAYKTTKAQQIPNTPTHQLKKLTNLQTYQLITSPPFQLTNSLTQKLSNLSTYQPVDSETHHLANSKNTNSPPQQLKNSSPQHLINLKTHQLINSKTHYLANLNPYYFFTIDLKFSLRSSENLG